MMKRFRGIFSVLHRFRLAYTLILPAIIGMLLVHFLPMLWGVYISFRNYNKFTIRKAPWDVKFVAFDHYMRAIKYLDKGFLQSLRVTLTFVIISLILCVALGLGAALLANRKFRGRTVFRGTMLIPYILPGVAYLTCLRFMFTYDGIINRILADWLGVLDKPIYWLIGQNTFWTIVIGNVWGRWPLFFLSFLAALQAISSDMYEAAGIDGASIWQQFRHITLPHLRGVGIIVIMLTVLWSFNNFIVPFVMLGGGYSVVPEPAELLSIRILRDSFNNLHFGFGAAESVLMTLIALVFVIIYLRRTRPQADEQRNGYGKKTRSLRKTVLSWSISVILTVTLIFLLGKDIFRILAVLAGVAIVVTGIWAFLSLTEKLAVRILFYSGVGTYLALVLFPVYWLVSSSLKIESEIRASTLFPRIIAWENYLQVWRDIPLARYFINSAIISGSAMLLAVSIATLAGYAFSRFRFPGRDVFGISILSTQMFPGILFLLPYFLIFTTLQRMPFFKALGGLKFIGENVYWGNISLLIFTYTAFVLPFAIWVVRGFMESIPINLEEAAQVDGCSQFQAFLRVILPLALPGIATVAILGFMKGWNEVLFSSVLTNPFTRTVALGIQDFRTQQTVTWNLTMAAGVLISVPVVIFFTFLQRYMVSGLTAGAVKG